MHPTTILASLVTLVVILPPMLDDAIKSRFTSAKMFALACLGIGLGCSAVGALLSQIDDGATARSAATVAVAGVFSGAATGLVNWWKAYGTPGGGAGASGVKRAVTGMALLALALFVAACSWFTPAKFADIAKISGCVYADIDKQMTPAQAAEDCGAADEQAVLDLLAAKAAAEHREGLVHAADAGQ